MPAVADTENTVRGVLNLRFSPFVGGGGLATMYVLSIRGGGFSL